MFDYTDKILNSPDALHQIEVLNEAIKEEKERRHEFREWVTPNMKAEFINGETILHSPVKMRHWKVSDLLSSLLSVYVRSRKLGKIGTEKVMISLTRNDYEPDLVFFSKEKMDKFEEDQMLFPAPNFVVEILSKKTAARDRGVKKEDYAAHGIIEYWIVDAEQKTIDQYTLNSPSDTKYTVAKTYSINDDIESKVIEGFYIPVKALFDEEENLRTIQSFIQM
jgi:Uma2 family endonuclease